MFYFCPSEKLKVHSATLGSISIIWMGMGFCLNRRFRIKLNLNLTAVKLLKTNKF